MKATFFNELFKIMGENEEVYIIFAGLGWPRVDEFLGAYPGRAFNFEASEQTVMDSAVGLSYCGKTVFTYTITPFYWRAAETVRTYINHEKLNVVMIGAGRDDDYSKDDGFSHDAADAPDLFGLFDNIRQYYPNNKSQIKGLLETIVADPHPCFISLRR